METDRTAMSFKLLPLPYAETALAPVMSARTVEVHHGKHQAGYVEKLNELVAGTAFARMSLEQIIQRTARERTAIEIFNNASQVWNHDFFWRSMMPAGGGMPTGELGSRLAAEFGSYEQFSEEFVARATRHFGSGWAWLVAEADRLRVVSTPNAESPLIAGQQALLACDIWEHAYYLDCQSDRKSFVQKFLEKLANWEFAAERLGRRDTSGMAAVEQGRRRKMRA